MTRTLVLLVAAEYALALEAAYRIGDRRWNAAIASLAEQVEDLLKPRSLWHEWGTVGMLAIFDDPQCAWEFARGIGACAPNLGVPLSVAIHAGEIDWEEGKQPGGVHLLAAREAAMLARSGALVITEPAVPYLPDARLQAVDMGVWQPPGLPVRWRISLLGTAGLRDHGHEATSDDPRRGLRLASLLTAREADIVLLVAAGESDRKIATTLGIAESTVQRHLANVYRKCDFTSRTQLARWWLAQGQSRTTGGQD